MVSSGRSTRTQRGPAATASGLRFRRILASTVLAGAIGCIAFFGVNRSVQLDRYTAASEEGDAVRSLAARPIHAAWRDIGLFASKSGAGLPAVDADAGSRPVERVAEFAPRGLVPPVPQVAVRPIVGKAEPSAPAPGTRISASEIRDGLGRTIEAMPAPAPRYEVPPPARIRSPAAYATEEVRPGVAPAPAAVVGRTSMRTEVTATTTEPAVAPEARAEPAPVPEPGPPSVAAMPIEPILATGSLAPSATPRPPETSTALRRDDHVGEASWPEDGAFRSRAAPAPMPAPATSAMSAAPPPVSPPTSPGPAAISLPRSSTAAAYASIVMPAPKVPAGATPRSHKTSALRAKATRAGRLASSEAAATATPDLVARLRLYNWDARFVP